MGLPPDDRAWMEQGECRIQHAPVKIFFPTSNSRDIGRAKKFCSVCQVRNECLVFCLTTDQLGIWGGTTDEDRSTRQRFPERYVS